MPPKKGDGVAPPARPGDGWEIRFGAKEAVRGWEELKRIAAPATWRAWDVMSHYPTEPVNRQRQHRLKGELSNRVVNGRNLEQWQYEVTGAARVFYCPDPERRIVWLMHAGPQHPKATE